MPFNGVRLKVRVGWFDAPVKQIWERDDVQELVSLTRLQLTRLPLIDPVALCFDDGTCRRE